MEIEKIRRPCRRPGGGVVVTPPREVCSVHEVQFAHLREDLTELKERVRGLETTLARGVLLLVANLVGMVLSLVRQLAGG